MKSLAVLAFEQLEADLVTSHPVPWYIDEANNARLIIKDYQGNIVLMEAFDNDGSEAAGQHRAGSLCLARFLIGWSQTKA